VWRLAHKRIQAVQPQAVVGFGGWLSVPILLAARQRHIPVLVHEQNVSLGRANRFLLRWADQMAVSFEDTCARLNGTPWTVTGVPIRSTIGLVSRKVACDRFGLDAKAPTILVLGGSQGSGAINRLVCEMFRELAAEDQAAWQFLHLTGAKDYAAVQQTAATFGIRGLVATHLVDMASAYALADVVVARAGASTIAELARCGIPAILIPYPHAGAHQRANARLIESVGGGVWLEEATATPRRVRGLLRWLLSDECLRRTMGERMRTLAKPHAAQQLAAAIVKLAQGC
jgi:UDP-N-acetylglucosamine--N-acetylmuramyl-(pentapeptide) pyrophosphoryl-undecaprenol N-acetylglucosamine transferase